MKFILLPILLITSCSVNEQTSKAIEEERFIELSHEYAEISDYELTWDSMFDVESEKYYVYIYSMTCSHCEELKDFIISKAIDRGDIYFIKGSSKDQLTNDSKKLIGAENPGDIYILGYPSLLQISNHKCTKNLAGTTQIKTELK